jgi:hypothetical protein
MLQNATLHTKACLEIHFIYTHPVFMPQLCSWKVGINKKGINKKGINKKWYSHQKCGVNIIEHSQSEGVKLKMREWKIKKCKLARGIKGGGRDKTDGHETMKQGLVVFRKQEHFLHFQDILHILFYFPQNAIYFKFFFFVFFCSSNTLCDFWLLLLRRWCLQSSGMLCSIEW